MKQSNARRLKALLVLAFAFAAADLLVLDLLVAPRAIDLWAAPATSTQPAVLAGAEPPDAADEQPAAPALQPVAVAAEPPDAAAVAETPEPPAVVAAAEPVPPEPAPPAPQAKPPEPPPPLAPITFEDAMAGLDERAREGLDRAARAMRATPGLRLEVHGHADQRGPKEGNERVAQKRAQVVTGYLIEKGIDPVRIEARSFGAEQPLDRRSTQEAWAKNRRVELIWKEPLP